MTQTIVAKKLAVYLRSLPAAEHPEARAYADELEENGNCYAFSVTHAALDDKLEWYESALEQIANWDEDLSKLDDLILLPQAKNNKAVPLRKIFDDIKDFIISLQGRRKIRSILTEVAWGTRDQLKDLVVVRGNKAYKPKGITCSAGNFTTEKLNKVISPEALANNICLVHNVNHTIRIGYKKGKWLLYDPNYLHLLKETIHKEFTTKEELIKEIFAIQGHSLALEVVSFDKKIHLPVTQNDIPACFKDMGLFMISRYTPEALDEIVKNTTNYVAKQEEKIKKLLKKQPKDQKSIAACEDAVRDVLKQFIESLIRPSKLNGSTAFGNILQTASHLIPEICVLIAKLPNSSSIMSEMLRASKDNGWTNFSLAIRYADPQKRQHLWQLFPKNAENKEFLIKNFSQVVNGWTGLCAFAKDATPAEAKYFLEWLTELTDSADLEAITKSFIAPNPFKETAFSLFPEHLKPEIIALFKRSHPNDWQALLNFEVNVPAEQEKPQLQKVNNPPPVEQANKPLAEAEKSKQTLANHLISIDDPKRYLQDVQKALDNNNQKELIGLICRKYNDNHRGLYLIYKRHPSLFRAVLNKLKSAEVMSDENGLSVNRVKEVINNYIHHKSSRFFGTNLAWKFVSSETLDTIALLFIVGNDAMRLQAAKEYIAKNQKRTFALELEKVVRRIR